MVGEVFSAFVDWAARPATPNGVWLLVLFAAVTRPSTWTQMALGAVRSRWPAGDVEAVEEEAGEGSGSA